MIINELKPKFGILLVNNSTGRLLLRNCLSELSHYRRALGAIVVYDITKERTFTNVRRWIEAIREQADPNVVIVLVGNKLDLRDYQVVSTADAKKWAKNEGIYFE